MEKKELYSRLSVAAKMFFINPEAETLKAMTEVIANYPTEKIILAFNKVPTLKRFPTIGEFIELINPTIQIRDEANEISGAILDAVRTATTDKLDDLSKLAIERFGGLQVLRLTELDQLPSVRAQLRDTVQSILAMKKRNPETEQLDYQKQTRQAIEQREGKIFRSLSESMKEITEEIKNV